MPSPSTSKRQTSFRGRSTGTASASNKGANKSFRKHVLGLTSLMLFAVSINVFHFHAHGGGSLIHVDGDLASTNIMDDFGESNSASTSRGFAKNSNGDVHIHSDEDGHKNEDPGLVINENGRIRAGTTSSTNSISAETDEHKNDIQESGENEDKSINIRTRSIPDEKDEANPDSINAETDEHKNDIQEKGENEDKSINIRTRSIPDEKDEASEIGKKKESLVGNEKMNHDDGHTRTEIHNHILPITQRHESDILRQIMDRSASVSQHCKGLPEHHINEPVQKDFDTGVPPLPEGGVQKAMKAWLDKEEKGENGKSNNNDRGDYPVCYLPPAKSCNVTKYSVILMSHTVDDAKRLRKLKNGIRDIAKFEGTSEIILVWNSPRGVLEESDKGDARLLVQWDADKTFPLRIFYSLENGLHNNLLNRYHPKVQPKEEAIVYFDDDGPFLSEIALEVGFELWRFNSDVQIGSMARNIRFPSKRMNEIQTETTAHLSKLYHQDAWQTHIHPYDTNQIEKYQSTAAAHDGDLRGGINTKDDVHAGYPQFTPLCNEESGDVVEYNYFVFPHYKGHMSLPSGSILHRNYMCFMWHPSFGEMRQFILDHPTHPDDMTMSTLVSHLSGKALRTFPRIISEDRDRSAELGDLGKETPVEGDRTEAESEQGRRKLLWQQKDWGNMREEAINSIVRYFGSINPGSVGWCAGTEYEKVDKTSKGSMGFVCESGRIVEMSKIPWMNKGGLGHDECHG